MNIEVYMVVFMEKKWSYIALWKGDIGHHVGGTHSFQFGKRSQDYVTRKVTIKLRSRESEPGNQSDGCLRRSHGDTCDR